MAYKVGLLVIATNKYIDFVEPLWNSAKKHFLVGQDVNLFLFTDKDLKASQIFKDDPKVRIILQNHMPWPGSTLFRYNVFDAARVALSEMDYLFYSDADMLFVDTVGPEILSDRVATIHPGFFDKPRAAFTYETNPSSTAFVAPTEGTTYYAGGFNGGTKVEYLRMCKVLSDRIAQDYQKGLIAVWHDESHLNRYMIDNPPTLSLSPSYCFPESWTHLPFQKRLLALDKNHKEMRK
jgi:histo-blood group ABO system transferase